MHVSLTKRLVGSGRDQRATFIAQRTGALQQTGALVLAALVADFLESFDEALVPMDDDVQQSAGASLR